MTSPPDRRQPQARRFDWPLLGVLSTVVGFWLILGLLVWALFV